MGLQQGNDMTTVSERLPSKKMFYWHVHRKFIEEDGLRFWQERLRLDIKKTL